MSLYYSRMDSSSEHRLPVVFLVDCSGSMGGSFKNKPIESVNSLLNSLPAVFSDLQYSAVDFSIISFSDRAYIERKFSPINENEHIQLCASGLTAMGEAIQLAYEVLADQRHYYIENAITYFKPIILMLTDGLPTDDPRAAIERIHAEKNRAIRFVSVGITGCDEHFLSELSPYHCFVDIDQTNLMTFLEQLFFRLIRDTMNTKARALPSEEIPVLPDAPLYGIDW